MFPFKRMGLVGTMLWCFCAGMWLLRILIWFSTTIMKEVEDSETAWNCSSLLTSRHWLKGNYNSVTSALASESSTYSSGFNRLYTLYKNSMNSCFKWNGNVVINDSFIKKKIFKKIEHRNELTGQTLQNSLFSLSSRLLSIIFYVKHE